MAYLYTIRNAQNNATMNFEAIFSNEYRMNDDGAIYGKMLSIIFPVIGIDCNCAEFDALEDELADGQDVAFMGYTIRRHYRRGGAVYTATPIRRKRRVVAY